PPARRLRNRRRHPRRARGGRDPSLVRFTLGLRPRDTPTRGTSEERNGLGAKRLNTADSPQPLSLFPQSPTPTERLSGKGVPSPLKGGKRKAQGNALGSRRRSNKFLFALKGRHKAWGSQGLCRPFRANGEGFSDRGLSPGRCPGLSCWAPSGREKASRVA